MRRCTSLLFAVAMAGAVLAGTTSALAGATGSERQINVLARSYAFKPNRIEIVAGETVKIRLKSTDTFHDFAVKIGKKAKVVVSASGGKSKTKSLQVKKPGTYTFYCTVPGHRSAGMVGKLIVTKAPPPTTTTSPPTS